ncbi:MAG: Holliday junction resolvase RuvX [Oscillospiraceae bacterium]|nr:Holliday junction resolvase RuvX [Oscillospiraceae bacterium]
MIILAVDPGDAHTGLALCDKGEMLAFPAGTVHETNRERLIKRVAEIAAEKKAELILIGYPKNRNGTIGERAVMSERFAKALGELVAPAKVILWDERGTTIAAHVALNQGTTRPGKKRQVVDAVAATILLEGYLDYRRIKNI